MIFPEIKKIYIDPSCNFHYAGFYLYGLRELLGSRVAYDYGRFSDIATGRNHSFFFIVETAKEDYRVAIDFHDPSSINPDVLHWADCYGKINYNSKETPISLQAAYPNSQELRKQMEKVVIIPPSFGFRALDLMGTSDLARAILFTRNMGFSAKTEALKGLVRMYIKRAPLRAYKRKKRNTGFVFLISSIWAKDANFINISRANFIRACKRSPQISFEGGLVPIGYGCDYIENLEEVKFGEKKIGILEYIEKTSRSEFTFNGPSVEHCHGWKLAEYLCLGKAIISTPLYNDLPFPLLHGENVHFINDDYASIQQAVDLLHNSPEYLTKLENGAAKYWADYASPQKVLSRIFITMFNNSQDYQP